MESDFREKHAAEYEKCETVMDKMNEETEGLNAKGYMNYSDKMAEDCPAYEELIKKQSQMLKSKLGI